MRIKRICAVVVVLLIFFFMSPVIHARSETNVVYIDTGFESDLSPQRCTFDGYTPKGFHQSDVGDGGSEVWVIDKNDNPSLNRLPPMGFVEGSKCIYCIDYVTPSTHPYNFLMMVPVVTKSLYVRWYEAFDAASLNASAIPIFWSFTSKSRLG